MEDKQLQKQLVQRYLESKATPPELEAFIHLFQQGELDQLIEEYLNYEISEETVVKSKPKNRWLRPLAAASIALLTISGVTYYTLKQSSIDYTQVANLDRKIKKITLSDGSVIWLNRNAALQYASKWQGNMREVELKTGEAYFQVAKNQHFPKFIVKTPNHLTVEVRGTEFNVKAGKEGLQVYLEGGKVALRREKEVTELTPGQLATYISSNKRLIVQAVKGDAWLAWKNELFIFDDTSLTQIATELETYYGIDVVIEDHLEALRFTGKISQKNLEQVLKILSHTLDVNIIHHKGRVTIRQGSATDDQAE